MAVDEDKHTEDKHAVEFQFDPENGLVRETHGGKLTLEGMIKTVATAQEHPLFEPGGALLVDLRGADFTETTSDDIRGLADHMLSVGSDRHPRKIAAIVKAPLGYGFNRMLQAYIDINELPIEHRVFESIKEAEEWLGVKKRDD